MNSSSATYKLCGLEQVTLPLCASLCQVYNGANKRTKMLRIKRVNFCEALCKCAISSSYRCSRSHNPWNSNLHSQTAGEKNKVLREKWSNDCERAEPGLTPSSLTSGLGRLSLPCLLGGGKMGEKADGQKAELQCYPSPTLIDQSDWRGTTQEGQSPFAWLLLETS